MMMANPIDAPLVSVLMPCYNAVATLDEALDSLSRQTLPDFEIVAVDDGSSDATLAILLSRAAAEPRLRVISQPHSGIVAALNRGLEACRAEYVARMDSDDCSRPERLRRQADFLQAQPEITLVGCRVEGFPAEHVRQGYRIYLDWLNSLLSEPDIRREIFIESPFAHPSVMYRKSVVIETGGYQEHGWAEDYDLWLRLYTNGGRFAKLERGAAAMARASQPAHPHR